MFGKLIKILNFFLENYRKVIGEKFLMQNVLIGLLLGFVVYMLLIYKIYVLDFDKYINLLLVLIFFKFFSFSLLVKLDNMNFVSDKNLSSNFFFFTISDIVMINPKKAKDVAIATFDLIRNVEKNVHNLVNPVFEGDHPTNLRIINVDKKKILVSTNTTSSKENATLISGIGEISDDRCTYLYNDLKYVELSNNNKVNIDTVTGVIDQVKASHKLKKMSNNLQRDPDLVNSFFMFQKQRIKEEFGISSKIEFESTSNLINNLENLIIEVKKVHD